MSRGGATAPPRGGRPATGPAGGPPKGGLPASRPGGGPPAPTPGGGPARAGGGPGGGPNCASAAPGAAAAPSITLADRVSKVFFNIPFLLFELDAGFCEQRREDVRLVGRSVRPEGGIVHDDFFNTIHRIFHFPCIFVHGVSTRN